MPEEVHDEGVVSQRDESERPGGVMALTCSAGGLQLIWSTMFSHGSAYLISLGITPSQSSLIWAAAPVCGALVPPCVGIWSDNCRSRYGRRRPFILGGAVCAIACLLGLAWIQEIETWLSIETVAILLVIVLNVAIQTLQLGLRSLIVDTFSPEQQPGASAWMSRFTGVGSILGYFAAAVPISTPAGQEEAWRFRYMALLATAALLCTVTTTVLNVREQSMHDELYEVQPRNVFFTLRKRIAAGVRDMPPRAKWVCKVQFFSCMAWFGFLFYSSTYVSGLQADGTEQHFSSLALVLPSDSMAVGSSANLLFAIVSFTTSVILPWIVQSFTQSPATTAASGTPEKSASLFSKLTTTAVALPTFWAVGNILYSFAVLATIFITYSFCGIILVGVVGVSWAIQNWVPFAIIGSELSSHSSHKYDLVSVETGDKQAARRDATSDSAVMMGLHSAAMSMPQIIAALVTSAIFKVAKEVGHEEHAVAWMLRTTAGATIVAAWWIWRGVREGQ